MPRDGSNIYHRPPGIDAVTDTSIESTKYNLNVADVEQDLNLPRPVVAGGTGATNAHDAMVALKGEIALQLVDNYDSFPFAPGSFYSIPGATTEPFPGGFAVGICYGTGIAGNLMLEARQSGTQILPPPCMVREYVNGTWKAWSADTASLDALKVNRSGDTMTGDLTIHKTTPTLRLDTPDGTIASVYGQRNGVPRWGMSLAGWGSGEDFVLVNYPDAGGPSAVMQVTRANGTVGFSGALSCGGFTAQNTAINGTLNVTGNITGTDVVANSGVYRFGSDPANHYLQWDGTNYNLAGGPLNVPAGGITAWSLTLPGGAILSDGTDLLYRTSGAQLFQNASGTVNRAILDASGNLTINNLACGGGVTVSSNVYLKDGNNYLTTDATNTFARTAGTFYVQKPGGGPAPVNCGTIATSGTITSSGSLSIAQNLQIGTSGVGAIYFLDGNHIIQVVVGTNIMDFHGVNLNCVDGGISSLGDIRTAAGGYKPGGGPWSDSSDARIKNVLGDYDSGLDEILALHPKRYTYKGNDTVNPPSNTRGPGASEDTSTPVVPYANSAHHTMATSGKEFIGLIAQDTEPVMPEMISQQEGYIDGTKVTDIRELDTGPLVFALINSIKTLNARIEELEAAAPARKR